MVLLNFAPKADGIAAKLASMTEHTSAVHIGVLLSLMTCFTALTLAVSLFGITRDVDLDLDLAIMVLSCRIDEGGLGAISIIAMLGLLWLGTANGPDAPDPAADLQ